VGSVIVRTEPEMVNAKEPVWVGKTENLWDADEVKSVVPPSMFVETTTTCGYDALPDRA
jgi:hypothetical protein